MKESELIAIVKQRGGKVGQSIGELMAMRIGPAAGPRCVFDFGEAVRDER